MSYKHIKLNISTRWLPSLIVIGAPLIYMLSKHADLGRKIQHQTIKGVLTTSTKGEIESIPAAALTHECPVIYDVASKTVTSSSLPAQDRDTLLTLYLRHTMQLFSRFPQAWMLRLVCSPEERKTFQAAHIQGLSFQEGDMVCGLYTVVARSPGKVEFAMKSTGLVTGRLSIAIEQKGENTLFRTETVMWKGNGEKTIMPLERKVFKWMHELASWYLLESGTRYLANM